MNNKLLIGFLLIFQILKSPKAESVGSFQSEKEIALGIGAQRSVSAHLCFLELFLQHKESVPEGAGLRNFQGFLRVLALKQETLREFKADSLNECTSVLWKIINDGVLNDGSIDLLRTNAQELSLMFPVDDNNPKLFYEVYVTASSLVTMSAVKTILRAKTINRPEIDTSLLLEIKALKERFMRNFFRTLFYIKQNRTINDIESASQGIFQSFISCILSLARVVLSQFSVTSFTSLPELLTELYQYCKHSPGTLALLSEMLFFAQDQNLFPECIQQQSEQLWSPQQKRPQRSSSPKRSQSV